LRQKLGQGLSRGGGTPHGRRDARAHGTRTARALEQRDWSKGTCLKALTTSKAIFFCFRLRMIGYRTWRRPSAVSHAAEVAYLCRSPCGRWRICAQAHVPKPANEKRMIGYRIDHHTRADAQRDDDHVQRHVGHGMFAVHMLAVRQDMCAVQECRRAGVQACRRAGVQACRRAGVQACRRAGVRHDMSARLRAAGENKRLRHSSARSSRGAKVGRHAQARAQARQDPLSPLGPQVAR